MNKDLTILLIARHPSGVVKEKEFTLRELREFDDCTLLEEFDICTCQPVGETNVVECNCEDFIEDFKIEEAYAVLNNVRTRINWEEV